MAVRWILNVLEAIPLTPWVHARREMWGHLRRYYAQGQ
jgi:hypothetical protein